MSRHIYVKNKTFLVYIHARQGMKEQRIIYLDNYSQMKTYYKK